MTITEKQVNESNAYTVSLIAALVYYLQPPQYARLRAAFKKM